MLIGPNGAGKTNFISFFRMLSWALTPPGNLQTYVAEQGGASTLLLSEWREQYTVSELWEKNVLGGRPSR